jgi:hypothetical protein
VVRLVWQGIGCLVAAPAAATQNPEKNCHELPARM